MNFTGGKLLASPVDYLCVDHGAVKSKDKWNARMWLSLTYFKQW